MTLNSFLQVAITYIFLLSIFMGYKRNKAQAQRNLKMKEKFNISLPPLPNPMLSFITYQLNISLTYH